ncbi:GntR family transcriptional regulator [Roseobacter sinensis]|uniref:GntR family transcriptional regulator n=1 Tax=Roseobacter sinensis TaxID=2931391 RepID=A0ABT3BKX1_9RHOB|nr:GntR family transcriptional regulator [Roseobacter sp. WL0113]MCV3273999.1 GntR family transcriptional regulator [Roseobacter sp. WL0113]
MTTPPPRGTTMPKYIQLSELLIRDIDAGRILDGERLPPERDMAVSLGTSIGTLRKALAELDRKGLLDRIQGSGNYVRRPARPTGVYAMFRLELLSGGGLPTAEVLELESLRKPADLPAFGSSDTATRIRRRRYLNDIAIAVEEIWLDGSAGRLTPEMLGDSLYQTYLDGLGFWIARAEDRVSIGVLPDWTPPDFGTPGTPSGYIERFGWASAPTAIEFSRTWFDTDKSVYVQRLK